MADSRALALLFVVVMALLAGLPLFADRFYMQFTSKAMILAAFAMSLDLLVGRTGLVSFGHALPLGIGGYAVVMLAPVAGFGFWSLALAGVLLAALVSALVGALALRTRGVYFIMVTLAFAQMGYYLVHDTRFFGGSDGKYLAARPPVEWAGGTLLDLSQPVGRFYLAWGGLLLTGVVLALVARSQFGRVLLAIRENEHRVRALGYPAFVYRLAAFVLAGAFAGLAGVLVAVQDGVMNPEFLSWHRSGAVLLAVILGGAGTLIGPALGAALLMLLELVTSSWTKHWPLVMGGFIIFMVLAFPRGLAGLLPHRFSGRFGDADREPPRT